MKDIFEQYEKVLQGQMGVTAGSVAVGALTPLAPAPVRKNINASVGMMGVIPVAMAGKTALNAIKYLDVNDDSMFDLW